MVFPIVMYTTYIPRIEECKKFKEVICELYMTWKK
jgi:hypothetical protein